MVIGWARGGRLDALGQGSLRGMPALGAAVTMALLALAAPLPAAAGRALIGAGYVLALAVLWWNRGRPWLLPILIGLGLNTAVIVVNGGRMPVAAGALEWISQPGGRAAPPRLDARHVIAGPGTPLAMLGDTIAVGARRMGLVASPGDLLMALGIAGFVQGRMAQGRAGPPRSRAGPPRSRARPRRAARSNVRSDD